MNMLQKHIWTISQIDSNPVLTNFNQTTAPGKAELSSTRHQLFLSVANFEGLPKAVYQAKDSKLLMMEENF